MRMTELQKKHDFPILRKEGNFIVVLYSVITSFKDYFVLTTYENIKESKCKYNFFRELENKKYGELITRSRTGKNIELQKKRDQNLSIETSRRLFSDLKGGTLEYGRLIYTVEEIEYFLKNRN